MWTDRPATSIIFQSSDWFVVPFSVFWLGSYLTHFGDFSSQNFSWSSVTFFDMMFISVGLYFLVGRFIHDIIKRKATYYALTNKKLLIKSGIGSSHLQSIYLNSLASIQIQEKSNGKGTLSFNSLQSPARNEAVPNFEGIDKVKSVYDLIQQSQAKILSTLPKSCKSSFDK